MTLYTSVDFVAKGIAQHGALCQGSTEENQREEKH